MGLLLQLRAELAARRAVKQFMSVQAIEKAAIAWDSLFRRGMESLQVQGTVTFPYGQVDCVYIAVSTIATNAASVPYGLFQDKNRVEAHEFYDLLSHPNDTMEGNLIEATLTWLELRGRVYWLMDQEATSGTGTRLPRRLRVLPPDEVKPKKDGMTLTGWTWTPAGGGSMPIPLEQLVRFYYFDPRDQFGGMGPLEAAQLGYNVQWKSSKWQENFYTNGAVPPFFVTYPDTVAITTDQVEDLKEKFKSQWLGMKNAGKPPMLFRGGELKPISVTQRDAEWIATQRLTREQILGVFKVPPAVAGVYEDANRSNSEVQRRLFWNNTISPKLTMIRSVIQRRIVDRFLTGLDFQFDVRGKMAEVIPEDMRASIESAGKLVLIGVPPSEAFRVLGINVDTAGKPWLDEGYLPTTLQLASDVGMAPADSGTVPPTPPKTVRRGTREQSARDAKWYSWEKGASRIERSMLGSYRRFLGWFRDRVLARISGKKEANDLLPTEADRWRRVLSEMDPDVRMAIESGWMDMMAEAGMDNPFDWMDPRVLKVLTDRQIAFKGASDTVSGRVRDSLSDGLFAGETAPQLEARVRAVMAEAYKGQARVVARTETMAALNGGGYASLEDAGVTKQEWLSSRDDRVRDSHVEMDGTVTLVGVPFGNGLLYPHDPAGPANETIQCRCTMLPVVEEGA